MKLEKERMKKLRLKLRVSKVNQHQSRLKLITTLMFMKPKLKLLLKSIKVSKVKPRRKSKLIAEFPPSNLPSVVLPVPCQELLPPCLLDS